MIYLLKHTSTYHYSGSVASSQQLLRLTPRTTAYQSCDEESVTIGPAPSERATYLDYFGNLIQFAKISEPHDKLVVTATSRVTVNQDARLLPDRGLSWEAIRDELPSDRTPEGIYAYQYVYESPKVPVLAELAAYARPSFAPGRPLIEACADLNERIFQDFEYDPASTTISTPVTEVLGQRAGVCQDFAHLMISALRSLGLAARYVSGYVRPYASGSDKENRGAADSHAWLSVFAGDIGWIDFDPTNRTRPGHLKTDHITLAWGRDYTDVAPIKGVTLGGGGHTIDVKVNIDEA